MPSLELKSNMRSKTDFTFQKRGRRIDWRLISAMDVDKIIRDVDVRVLQAILMDVTFCNIETELDFDSDIDPNFIKLFRAAQLIIEYLIYCQQNLERTASELREQSARQTSIAAANKANSNACSFVQCPHCPKSFLDADYMIAHIKRRHSNPCPAPAISAIPPPPPCPTSPENAKIAELERELTNIRERLRQEETLRQAQQMIEQRQSRHHSPSRSAPPSETSAAEMRRVLTEALEQQRREAGRDTREIGEMLKETIAAQLKSLAALKCDTSHTTPKSNLGDLVDMQQKVASFSKGGGGPSPSRLAEMERKLSCLEEDHMAALNKLTAAICKQQDLINSALTGKKASQSKREQSTESGLSSTPALPKSKKTERSSRSRATKRDSLKCDLYSDHPKSSRSRPKSESQGKSLNATKPKIMQNPKPTRRCDSEESRSLRKFATSENSTDDDDDSSSVSGSSLTSGVEPIKATPNRQMIDQVRQSLDRVVNRQLGEMTPDRKALGSTPHRIPDEIFAHEQNYQSARRQDLAKKYPDFVRIRNELETSVSDQVKRRLSSSEHRSNAHLDSAAPTPNQRRSRSTKNLETPSPSRRD